MVGLAEYYHGMGGNIKPWEDFMRSALNFTVLHNTLAKLDGAAAFPSRGCAAGDDLYIAGVPDYWVGEPDTAAATAELPAGAEWLMLSHQPGEFPNARDAGVGLQLSGHVHAGQCFPLHMGVWAAQRGRFSGLYREADSFLYVSNGQMNWGPRVRLYSSPENTVVRIMRGISVLMLWCLPDS